MSSKLQTTPRGDTFMVSGVVNVYRHPVSLKRGYPVNGLKIGEVRNMIVVEVLLPASLLRAPSGKTQRASTEVVSRPDAKKGSKCTKGTGQNTSSASRPLSTSLPCNQPRVPGWIFVGLGWIQRDLPNVRCCNPTNANADQAGWTEAEEAAPTCLYSMLDMDLHNVGSLPANFSGAGFPGTPSSGGAGGGGGEERNLIATSTIDATSRQPYPPKPVGGGAAHPVGRDTLKVTRRFKMSEPIASLQPDGTMGYRVKSIGDRADAYVLPHFTMVVGLLNQLDTSLRALLPSAPSTAPTTKAGGLHEMSPGSSPSAVVHRHQQPSVLPPWCVGSGDAPLLGCGLVEPLFWQQHNKALVHAAVHGQVVVDDDGTVTLRQAVGNETPRATHQGFHPGVLYNLPSPLELRVLYPRTQRSEAPTRGISTQVPHTTKPSPTVGSLIGSGSQTVGDKNGALGSVVSGGATASVSQTGGRRVGSSHRRRGSSDLGGGKAHAMVYQLALDEGDLLEHVQFPNVPCEMGKGVSGTVRLGFLKRMPHLPQDIAAPAETEERTGSVSKGPPKVSRPGPTTHQQRELRMVAGVDSLLRTVMGDEGNENEDSGWSSDEDVASPKLLSSGGGNTSAAQLQSFHSAGTGDDPIQTQRHLLATLAQECGVFDMSTGSLLPHLGGASGGVFSSPDGSPKAHTATHHGSSSSEAPPVVISDVSTISVAVKSIPMPPPQDRRFGLLQQEIETMRQCGAHPHLVRMYGAYKEGPSKIALVMELCDGGTLEDLIHQHGTLTEWEAAAILRCLVFALHHLHHDLRVVHRDIKPANIFLGLGGGVKLGDLGVAKYISSPQTHAGTGVYIAPEMSRGLDYDERVDIYSAGVVLQYMLSGSEDSLGRHWRRSVGSSANEKVDAAEKTAQSTTPVRGFFAPTLKMTKSTTLNLAKRSAWTVSRRLEDKLSVEGLSLVNGMIEIDPAARLSLAQVLRHPFMQRFCGVHSTAFLQHLCESAVSSGCHSGGALSSSIAGVLSPTRTLHSPGKGHAPDKKRASSFDRANGAASRGALGRSASTRRSNTPLPHWNSSANETQGKVRDHALPSYLASTKSSNQREAERPTRATSAPRPQGAFARAGAEGTTRVAPVVTNRPSSTTASAGATTPVPRRQGTPQPPRPQGQHASLGVSPSPRPSSATRIPPGGQVVEPKRSERRTPQRRPPLDEPRPATPRDREAQHRIRTGAGLPLIGGSIHSVDRTSKTHLQPTPHAVRRRNEEVSGSPQIGLVIATRKPVCREEVVPPSPRRAPTPALDSDRRDTSQPTTQQSVSTLLSRPSSLRLKSQSHEGTPSGEVSDDVAVVLHGEESTAQVSRKPTSFRRSGSHSSPDATGGWKRRSSDGALDPDLSKERDNEFSSPSPHRTRKSPSDGSPSQPKVVGFHPTPSELQATEREGVGSKNALEEELATCGYQRRDTVRLEDLWMARGEERQSAVGVGVQREIQHSGKKSTEEPRLVGEVDLRDGLQPHMPLAFNKRLVSSTSKKIKSEIDVPDHLLELPGFEAPPEPRAARRVEVPPPRTTPEASTSILPAELKHDPSRSSTQPPDSEHSGALSIDSTRPGSFNQERSEVIVVPPASTPSESTRTPPALTPLGGAPHRPSTSDDTFDPLSSESDSAASPDRNSGGRGSSGRLSTSQSRTNESPLGRPPVTPTATTARAQVPPTTLMGMDSPDPSIYEFPLSPLTRSGKSTVSAATAQHAINAPLDPLPLLEAPSNFISPSGGAGPVGVSVILSDMTGSVMSMQPPVLQMRRRASNTSQTASVTPETADPKTSVRPERTSSVSPPPQQQPTTVMQGMGMQSQLSVSALSQSAATLTDSNALYTNLRRSLSNQPPTTSFGGRVPSPPPSSSQIPHVVSSPATSVEGKIRSGGQSPVQTDLGGSTSVVILRGVAHNSPPPESKPAVMGPRQERREATTIRSPNPEGSGSFSTKRIPSVG